jgi:flavodoxin I
MQNYFSKRITHFTDYGGTHMARIGIFYGSSTGNTADVANMIHRAFGAEAAPPKDISEATAEEIGAYDRLILGASTWGAGDLQDDWDDALGTIETLDLSGTRVAIFGLGDQDGYPDSFVDGIGILAEAVTARGAGLVGSVPADGYQFDASRALGSDGRFKGLPLDIENQEDLTEGRVSGWVETLKGELA